MESDSSNKSNPALACGFLPGAIIHLQQLLLDELTPCNLTTVTECHFWVVSAPEFRLLVSQYPEITHVKVSPLPRGGGDVLSLDKIGVG